LPTVVRNALRVNAEPRLASVTAYPSFAIWPTARL
jgi:hypothetical protein